MWSQFLVIWYGNLPEETYFIFYRLYGVWRPVGIAVFLLVFLIPFIGLLGMKPKLFAGLTIASAVRSKMSPIGGAHFRDACELLRPRGDKLFVPIAKENALGHLRECSLCV